MVCLFKLTECCSTPSRKIIENGNVVCTICGVFFGTI